MTNRNLGHPNGNVLRKLAADHIKAVELGEERWAHYADETRTWWVFDESDLLLLGEYLFNEVDDAYSHWCNSSSAVEMPNGWEPEQWNNNMTKEEAIAVLENLIRRAEGTDLLSADDKQAIRCGIEQFRLSESHQ